MDRLGAEHTAQTIHHRLTTTIPSQGPDHTGERTERIRTSFIPGAVRDLPRYHSSTQRPLRPIVRRLYRRLIQKTQQIPTIVLPAKLVLQPPVVSIRTAGGLADDGSTLVSTAPSPQHSPPPLPDGMTPEAPSPL